MLQGLLIPGIYWSLIRLLLPGDKNSAQYSTKLLTLQRPLAPQGHFKSLKSPYHHTRANKVVCVCVLTETCGSINTVKKKHQYVQELNDNRLEAFKCNHIYFCCLATYKKRLRLQLALHRRSYILH